MILVDRCLDNESIPWWLRWLRRYLFSFGLSQVLLHEIGHHIHTMRPEFREREDVADAWGARLSKVYISKCYPIFLRLLRAFVKLVGKARCLKLMKALISRLARHDRGLKHEQS